MSWQGCLLRREDLLRDIFVTSTCAAVVSRNGHYFPKDTE